MRSIFFEELNLITIIPCVFFRLINYKIYYFKISKLLQNLRLIILLKKNKYKLGELPGLQNQLWRK